ncbi:MBL fold metallo-hydrolase [Conexibacter arvalis]|uniref:Glyoxylase-like metal-dependent hydrolase (Beta-lactamase superfamily II) n=1 Tax=Conexibacter arvalis TaxID=912552 RepID=A0A840IJL4_9ACTN|nr:MBL fold metallo-hydrolase [Conexibacter arvalis]MBB4664140.1 glyoxylase-like metal-dependent hydrolase (beta-lactamase superfamily II) [Conexibacter arvalis]
MEAIDVHHLGIERVICAWKAGDVLVDPGPEPALPTLLEALGDWRPRALLLTHIHLDHAGATGALAARWPDVEVYVHERGAPHVIDPSKLMGSAGRLYGEDNMKRLWGDVLPVPAERVHALTGGESLPLAGGIRVAYTPGHASHHVAYLHEESGRAFVGDVCGVRIPPSRLVIAPTPPPDIDVEAWEASLDLIADWRPASLGLTHFGAVDEPGAQLEAVRASLRDLAGLARRGDADMLENAVRGAIERETDGPATAQAYEAAVPPSHLHLGLERYWRKRAEREADAATGPR